MYNISCFVSYVLFIYGMRFFINVYATALSLFLFFFVCFSKNIRFSRNVLCSIRYLSSFNLCYFLCDFNTINNYNNNNNNGIYL